MNLPQHPQQADRPIAAIDIGSNSVHLVIAMVSPSGTLQILDSEKILLRLGAAIGEDKVLPQDAINRTIESIARLKEICLAHHASIRAVATHATREATNHTELVNAVKSATGIHVEIIDGIEEARLCFLGMRHGLAVEGQRCLAADIGGGSTEIIVGQRDEIDTASSIKLGAVTLTKKFLGRGKVSKHDIEELERYIFVRLSSLVPEAQHVTFERAIASSGTAKALAQIEARINNKTPPADANGCLITSGSLRKICRDLRELAEPRRIKSKFNLDSDRADIILAGALILERLTDIYNVKEWVVSGFALREGLVIDTAHRIRPNTINNHQPDIRMRSVIEFGRKFRLDEKHSMHVARLAVETYDSLAAHTLPGASYEETRNNRDLVFAAAYLYEIGKRVAYPRFHRHSGYIISNSSMMGFTENEKHLMGYIARFHRKRLVTQFKSSSDGLLKHNVHKVNLLSTCLRIASALDRSRRSRISKVEVALRNGRFYISIHDRGTGRPDAELGKLADEQRYIEKALSKPVIFVIQKP